MPELILVGSIVVGLFLAPPVASEDMDGGADLTGQASSEGEGTPEVEAVPSPAPAAPEDGDLTVESPVVQPPPFGVWDRLAQCESNGRWAANTGNGYFGGLQEDMTFWRRHGGLAYAPRPDLASRAAQIAVAARGQAIQGWGAWPVCSRRIGLR